MRIARRDLDAGSSLTLVSLLMGVITLLIAGLGVGLQFARLEIRTQAMADLSSLAAADTIAGIIAGLPCENAEQIALKNGADFFTCRIVSSVVSVSVGTEHHLGAITRDARARPAGASN